MKFGIRQCANLVFRAKQETKIGTATFHVGQPVLYIDTATTSSLEQASTTVYAQGGRGNARLLAWEGDKTLTFTVEDALLSPIGFSILSGAGLFKELIVQKRVRIKTLFTSMFQHLLQQMTQVRLTLRALLVNLMLKMLLAQ